ncbi:MAG: hypothetical protein IPO37_21160 [Saprospiraceae bacterium]|nr:hypothetical protein [Saprospiraceae bacterium]
MTKEEYISACKNVDLKIEEEQEKALKYLKVIGDVIHFGEDYLVENIIVLNPIWLTQAIYAIISEETLDEFHQKGIFTRDWFYDFMLSTSESKTISYSKVESNHILNFMLKNNLDICYTSDNQTFIIPLCMPEKLPDHHFDEKGGLIVLFRYETVPPGLVSRLIVRMSEYVDDSLVAKNAVILRKGQARAKIDEYFKEGDANKYLKIVVKGSIFDKYTLMNEIKSVLKEIKRQWFKSLAYSEEIPCVCAICKDIDMPYFHPLDSIRNRVDLGKTTIECKATGNDVSISLLLGHTSDKKVDGLIQIVKILKDLQVDSKMNAEFNMAISAALIEINEPIMTIDGNTTKKPLSSLDKIFEKGKRVKDWVSILKVPTDSIDVVDKLLSYIEAYKEIVSR